MGTWTRNFLVPNGDGAVLRGTIVRWMERKGFDPAERSSLFADDSDDERGVYLVSNAQWTVILYREAFEEGDRLLAELDDLPVVLEVVIADSDVWAYELLEQGELTAAFISNPRHFGGDDQKLPKNGDPERLCRALGMEGREAEVRRVQNRRSLFADFRCRTFCRLIGAPAGALHFVDLEGWNDGRLEAQNVGGWRIEPLYFERRRQFGEAARPLSLHSLAIREFETRAARQEELAPEFVAQMRRQAQIIGLLFKPLQWVLMGIGPLFRWWFRRQVRKPASARTGDPLLDALASTPTEPFQREGEWLVNRKYGCRLRIPGDVPAGSLPLFRMPHEVFRFSVEGITVTALAIRPDKLRDSFTLRTGMTLIADDCFFAGTHPARNLVLRVEEGQKTRFVQQWFVELEHVVFLFDASSQELLRPEAANAIKAVVQTFELTQV
jgi:hypothetical protein